MSDRAAAEAPYYPIYGEYHGTAPLFFDRAACPWVEILERNWTTVRQEILDYLAGGATLQPNFDPYAFRVTGWKSINFYTYRRRYHANCTAFPRTLSILDSIPHLTSAYINLLEPHSQVPAHNGDTNTVYRCHVGLVIPADVDTCGIQVGAARRGWREGEAFVFCDAHRHFAWNQSDGNRLILVVDVMRPEYRDDEKRICGRVLAAIGVLFARTQWPVLTVVPLWLLRPVHYALGMIARGLTAVAR